MTDVLGFVAWLLLPFIGLAIWRLEEVRQLALDGRVAIAGAAGALFTGIVMSAMAIVQLEWSRTRLVLALATLAFLGFVAVSRRPSTQRSEESRDNSRHRWAVGGVLVLFAITLYSVLTARATIGDLLFFWGPKGIHFFRAGTIDVHFLRNPDHFLQHRDYPPLLPLLLAWSNTLSRTFSWWAALLLSILCLAAIVAMVRAFSRDTLSALLTTSVLAWCFVRAWVGGGADPLLLVYEALAVCALVFVRDAKSQTILVAIGLGAAVVTKVEGASFLVAVVVAMLLHRVPWKRITVMLVPAGLLLGGWLTFIVRAQLLDTYRGPGEFSLQYFAAVMKGTFAQASYDAYWIPWIAPLIVLFLGDVRRARLPLTVAALTLGAALYIYLKSPSDPTVFWIPSSAHRVLLTPLLMLLIAAAAAHAKPARPAALVG